MARPLRIQFPGACYHVMNRGEKGNKIFFNDSDRNMFLSLLVSAVDMFRIKVFAFSLMDNHFHLLLQTMEANLAKVMRHIGGVYTQRINRKYKLDGHVFRGRYKSILVDRDSYLLEVIRYIHLNPVRAGLVKAPEEHRWTSHRLYIAPVRQYSWVSTGEILALFGKDTRSSRLAFNDFVKQGVPERIRKFYSQKHLPALLGSPSFIEKIRERYVKRYEEDYELPEAKRIGKIPLNEIAKLVAREYQVDVDKMRRGRKKVKNQPRRMAIYIAKRYVGYSLRDIGEFFQIGSYTGVSSIVRRVRKELLENRQTEEKLNSLLKTLRLEGNKSNA